MELTEAAFYFLRTNGVRFQILLREFSSNMTQENLEALQGNLNLPKNIEQLMSSAIQMAFDAFREWLMNIVITIPIPPPSIPGGPPNPTQEAAQVGIETQYMAVAYILEKLVKCIIPTIFLPGENPQIMVFNQIGDEKKRKIKQLLRYHILLDGLISIPIYRAIFDALY